MDLIVFDNDKVYVMTFSFFRHKNEELEKLPSPLTTTGISTYKTENGLVDTFTIPEPTRSLIFVTSEDVSKIENPMAFTLNLGMDISEEDGHVKITVDSKESGFFAEPSLIWTRLPIEPNDEHVTEAMYYPSYSKFFPKTRYEYVRWLQDITKETNLSYVFLYFYGLERHLLIGEYEKARDEVIRLLKYHHKSSFKYYASNSLLAASIARGRLDIIHIAPELFDIGSDTILSIMMQLGKQISPQQVMDLASWVGFTNRRYIKLHPDLFKQQIAEIELKEGNLLNRFSLEDFKFEEATLFANMSIPDRFRRAKLPIILRDSKFQEEARALLQQAHEGVKSKLARERKSKLQ